MLLHHHGIDLHYTIDGTQGPWVIMSHSLGCTSSMWDPQVPALAARYRVLRFDTRGHGGSSAPSGAYTLAQLADDAKCLLDHHDITQAHWVGLSMGGMIGQIFALQYPGVLQSLVLADTTSAHTSTPVSMWEERIRIAQEEGMEPLVEPAIKRWFTDAFRAAHPAVVSRVAADIRATPVNGWSGCCAAIAQIHTTEQLHRIPCPALVMVGEHDVGTPLAAAELIHQNLPDSRLVVIRGAAHIANIEQSAQFTEALLNFLDQVDPPVAFP